MKSIVQMWGYLGVMWVMGVGPLAVGEANGAVPQMISYQGKVAVGGVNFQGNGVFRFALVNGAGTTSYWSNDGTSVGGGAPVGGVTLGVTKGLYTVLLGDTSLANMTAIANSVFANTDVRLRVWFNDGLNGVQLLTPDQRLSAVGYAMVASTLQSGAVITSSTAAAAASLANSTDNPAVLGLSTSFRSWWVGQNRAPDATFTPDNFFIYDQQANATRLRIDTGGIIYGNGGGLTNISAGAVTGMLPASQISGTLPASQISGMLPASQVASVPEGFALIPAGVFQMGDALDGDGSAPVHNVTVSEFYMGKKEVTKGEWDEVQQWGTLVGGYTSLAVGAGKGAGYPVTNVSWYDVVKWCNAKSEREGLMPAYYTDNAQTVVYRVGNVNVTNVQVKWGANGYRLPTEAEWEKAGRGGLVGKRFPNGNTISESVANYYGATASFAYDLGPNGLNAIGSVGGTSPATSPVGSFAENGYGLKDMAGNVWEWCWDWADNLGTGPVTDPRGADTGTARVVRGGSWYNDAYGARVSIRIITDPSSSSYDFGFRVVRSSVP